MLEECERNPISCLSCVRKDSLKLLSLLSKLDNELLLSKTEDLVYFISGIRIALIHVSKMNGLNDYHKRYLHGVLIRILCSIDRGQSIRDLAEIIEKH